MKTNCNLEREDMDKFLLLKKVSDQLIKVMLDHSGLATKRILVSRVENPTKYLVWFSTLKGCVDSLTQIQLINEETTEVTKLSARCIVLAKQ